MNNKKFYFGVIGVVVVLFFFFWFFFDFNAVQAQASPVQVSSVVKSAVENHVGVEESVDLAHGMHLVNLVSLHTAVPVDEVQEVGTIHHVERQVSAVVEGQHV